MYFVNRIRESFSVEVKEVPTRWDLVLLSQSRIDEKSVHIKEGVLGVEEGVLNRV